jgi:DNA-binding MarR family transcriptional regulator
VLAKRLKGMVDCGLLERSADAQDARRRHYRLTPASRGLLGYMMCLSDWTAQHHLDQPSSIVPIHACGHEFKPLVVCSHCREPLLAHEVTALYSRADAVAGEPTDRTARAEVATA